MPMPPVVHDRRRRLALAGAVMALAVTSCGVSGKGGSATPPSPAELRSLLPTAAEVGHGYRSETPEPDDEEKDDAPSAADAATTQACPEAAAFDDGVDGEQQKATFVATDDSNSHKVIEVALSGAGDIDFAEDEVDDVVTALNACKTIRYRDGDRPVTAKLSAQRNDRYGDFGMNVRLEVSFGRTDTLTITYSILLFVHGPVGARVTATSGIDPATYRAVPGDPELIDPIAQRLDQRIGRLVD